MNRLRSFSVLLVIILFFCLPAPSESGRLTSGVKNTTEFFSKCNKKIKTWYIERGHTGEFKGTQVKKRSSTFDPKQQDAKGRTNKERMDNGLAPIGKDGKEVNLHHVNQKNDGKIVEVTNSEHNKLNSEMHKKNGTSEIDRVAFNKWKREYWKERSKEF